ncbi:5056_t:CDS:2, partial [Racocetra fulgida]
STTITNPDLILENFIKFSQIVSSINWNRPIVVMTDSTKLRPKLVYSGELNYIAGSILSHSETTIEILEDIHPKIDYILKNNAIATQIPIEKVLPVMIAMLPMKGNENAEQIAHLIHQVIEMSHMANLNILSFGADGARSEFNDLQECTRIAFNEAVLLAKYIHIYNYKEEFLIPEFTKYIEQITDIVNNENDELNVPNSLDNDQLHKDETLNNDEISYNESSVEDEDMIQQLSSFTKFSEIQYIIQHSPIPVSFHSFQQFFTNDALDFNILLQIRQNHDAFSPHMKSNFSHLHQTTIDKNHNKINENVVNKLITEITSDNVDENRRKK